MSLRDLTNDTARDATDFATEMAVDSVGAKGDIAGSGAIVPQWSDPPGGSAQRPLGLMYESDSSHGKILANGVISTLCV